MPEVSERVCSDAGRQAKKGIHVFISFLRLNLSALLSGMAARACGSEWQGCAAGGALLGKERGWRGRWEGDAGGIYDNSYNYIFCFLKSPVGGSCLSFMIPRLGGGTTPVL